MTKIEILPILNDNYCYILHGDDGSVAIVDPGDASAIIDHLNQKNLKLDLIINTHHHWDHTDGNAELAEKYHCPIAAPQGRVKNTDIILAEGDDFKIGSEAVNIIATPGHTLDHICLHFPQSTFVITADTLFVMGSGRLFEGTAEMLFESFQKLRALPDETKIYPGHEYTLSNAEFCYSIAPDNKAIQKRLDKFKAMREREEITIPSTIGKEKETNLFFMAETADELAELRALKDSA